MSNKREPPWVSFSFSFHPDLVYGFSTSADGPKWPRGHSLRSLSRINRLPALGRWRVHPCDCTFPRFRSFRLPLPWAAAAREALLLPRLHLRSLPSWSHPLL